MYSLFPKLCDLVASLNSSFTVPYPKNAKGYVFLPGLTTQVSVAVLHKIQEWYISNMRESTVNQLSSYYDTLFCCLYKKIDSKNDYTFDLLFIN